LIFSDFHPFLHLTGSKQNLNFRRVVFYLWEKNHCTQYGPEKVIFQIFQSKYMSCTRAVLKNKKDKSKGLPLASSQKTAILIKVLLFFGRVLYNFPKKFTKKSNRQSNMEQNIDFLK